MGPQTWAAKTGPTVLNSWADPKAIGHLRNCADTGAAFGPRGQCRTVQVSRASAGGWRIGGYGGLTVKLERPPRGGVTQMGLMNPAMSTRLCRQTGKSTAAMRPEHPPQAPPPAVVSHALQHAFASSRTRRMKLWRSVTEMTPRASSRLKMWLALMHWS